jgi:type II secretion system protein G
MASKPNAEPRAKAFTLIELLVVIAIIGLLASIVLVALNSARAKSRDAKRVADLRELQSALELYYTDNGVYPQTSCESPPGGAQSACWSTFLSSYVGSMPTDPLNVNATYGYYYSGKVQPNAGGCGYTHTGSDNNYILTTRLENPSAFPGSCPSGFSGWNNGSLNYIVGM